jgi:hypothetical protein
MSMQDGEAELELAEWQIVMQSLSVTTEECRS